MIFLVRRSLALVSGLALAVSIAIYGASFAGLTFDAMFLWAFVLHLGIFALAIPMYAIGNSSIQQRRFFWKGFANGRPTWAVPGIKILGIFCIAHFVLFLVLSHAASPEFVNGQFVLNDHGTIKKILTHNEYLSLKGDELRLFATGWIFFYFVATAYWWFPSKRHPLNT
jgi:hypothetical protein